jgi:hypothetical protein
MQNCRGSSMRITDGSGATDLRKYELDVVLPSGPVIPDWQRPSVAGRASMMRAGCAGAGAHFTISYRGIARIRADRCARVHTVQRGRSGPHFYNAFPGLPAACATRPIHQQGQ